MWLYLKTFLPNLKEINFKFLKRGCNSMKENIYYHKSLIRFTFIIIFLVFLLLNTIFFSYFFLGKSLSFIQQKTDIILEISTWVSKFEIDPLISRFKSIDWVVSVDYISWEKSLDDFKLSHQSLVWIIEKYNIDNPLPDVIEIRLQNIEASTIARSIIREGKYSDVINQDNMAVYDKQQEKIIKFSKYLLIMFYVWLVCFISFLILYFIIIKNTFSRIVSYHIYQIKILKNFWASFFSIRFPYFLESFYFSFFWFISSFFISLFLFYLFLISMWIGIESLDGSLIFSFIINLISYFLFILFLILTLSWFVSVLTTKKYLY